MGDVGRGNSETGTGELAAIRYSSLFVELSPVNSSHALYRSLGRFARERLARKREPVGGRAAEMTEDFRESEVGAEHANQRCVAAVEDIRPEHALQKRS